MSFILSDLIKKKQRRKEKRGKKELFCNCSDYLYRFTKNDVQNLAMKISNPVIGVGIEKNVIKREFVHKDVTATKACVTRYQIDFRIGLF